MARTSQSLYDRHITVFSPEGRLYQVAVKGCNITAIAVRGATCACVVTQKKVPLAQAQQDKLLDMRSVTSLHNVTEHIGVALIGLPGDCRLMLYRSREAAFDSELEFGYPVPLAYLTQRIADLIQVYSGIYIGIDEETNDPYVYRFDPAGWCAGYKACAVGTKEQEASIALEKVIKNKDLSTEASVIEEILQCFQSVLGVDLKASEIEVGIVTKKDPEFRLLTEEEIDNALTIIAEKD